MEPMGAISEGEWGSLSGMYTAEEADFVAQILNNNALLPNELIGDSSLGVPSTFWPAHESSMNVEGLSESPYRTLYMANSNLCSFSNRSYKRSMSMDFGMMGVKNIGSFLIEGDDCLNQEKSDGNAEEPAAVLPQNVSVLHREETQEMPLPELIPEGKYNNAPDNSKKRSRITGDSETKKRTLQSKKNKKTSDNGREDNNTDLIGQSSSSCSSEDDCNVNYQEPNGGLSSHLSKKEPASSILNGKTRASRGSATDPQSLYARKRRERINERLRILQNLVPNGTKVDISTMLDEAVQYVKFLQLQIKLLSSDDLWMYAPLAYNGVDIGLDLKINLPKQQI
ncbi:hypothetical protein I3760_05G017200 [Carya illinoinensis]|nr:hypothetical protein I3760_05G017200 [Carya illinoinensis]